MTKTKVLYPKVQKKMTGSLTDSSKSVMSKKVAGALLGSALLFTQNPSADAVYTTTTSPALPYPAAADSSGHSNAQGPVKMTVIDSATCSHASGIVNGHYSGTPNVNSSYTEYELRSHGNHGNHSNHSNHCSCSRWM